MQWFQFGTSASMNNYYCPIIIPNVLPCYVTPVFVVVRPLLLAMPKNITWERYWVQCFPLWLINPIMRRRLCRIPDTGDFLKQVSRRSLWICAADASSEPLLSCLAKKGQCLCWLCYARQVGLEPRSPRFQHLYQRFTVMLWDSLIVLCFLCPPCCHFPLLGRRVSGILGVSSTQLIGKILIEITYTHNNNIFGS